MNSPTTVSKSILRHRQIHLLGIIVLVFGMLAALAIYLVAISDPGAQNVPNLSNDRRFNLELERIGGKSAIYLAIFDRWLASLWHGTSLAFTVGALSVVVALACFWLADLMSYPSIEFAQPPENMEQKTSRSQR